MAAETLGQEVSRRLLRDLQGGVFPAGSKLPPERELMVRYAVGRNTLREAVRGVVALGLLEVQAGVGTTVKRTDSAEKLVPAVAGDVSTAPSIDDLLEYRLLVETEAAGLAAERASKYDLTDVRKALATYQDAVRQAENVYARDVAFHRSITAAAHNPIFLSAIDASAELLELAMRNADRAEGDVSEAAAEHALIAHYVVLGDASAARAAMRSHLLAGRDRGMRRDDPVTVQA